MDFFDSLVNFVLRFLILLLYIAVYTYIIKLEETGCPCSVYESRDFLKNFSLFSCIYLIVTMFVSPHVLFRSIGPVGSSLYVILDIIYIVLSIYFFWESIQYTRFLINEKCKCSEDMRRELIMWGSIIEMILIVMLLLINMLIPIVGSCGMSIISSIDKSKSSLSNAIRDPVKEIKKSPSTVKQLFSKTKKTSKDLMSKASKVLNK